MAIRSANPPLVLIAGPTASGKSALALALAERVSGVVINADSAQVYRELPILSAGPTAEDYVRAEHRLYGFQDGALPCSAADWAARARTAIADVHAQGRTPILVGGTGLYIRTLLDGIAPVPEIDPAIRQAIREAPTEENRRRLAELDPGASAKLKPADKARIARALEVVVSTGKPLAEWQKDRTGGIANEIDLSPLVLLPPREWLYRRCDERFSRMIGKGGMKEVQALLARNLDPRLPVMRAIGVREIASFLRGDASVDEAVAAGQQATRRYAKRQYTWFAHQPPAEWRRFHEPVDAVAFPRALELVETEA